jgi:endonuclease YncB( thermonuclease family)
MPHAPRTLVLPVAACAFAVLAAGAAAGEVATICAGLEPGPTRAVTRIVDGETVVLDDGMELRLTGALAPRAFDADAETGAWPMEAATREALRGLVLGRSIELAFAGARIDRYGRLQAQAILVGPGGRRWVQGHLLGHGFARAYALAGNRACGEELLAAERAARLARRGLWAEAAYQIRRADKPSELLRYRTTFQVVEGKIVRVAEVRGTIYLNFGRYWRRAFSASLRRYDRQLLGEHAVRPKDLEGKVVRVRGWIEERRGAPVIDLSVAGNLELVDAPVRPEAAQPEGG